MQVLNVSEALPEEHEPLEPGLFRRQPRRVDDVDAR
jgi:hypothetical protein